jgi:Interleukin-like EMT inducer
MQLYGKRIGRELFVFTLFVISAIVLTYPLIFQITDHLPGSGSSGGIFVWNLWHFSERLLEGANPFFGNYIFFPEGSNLLAHNYLAFHGLLALPLTRAFGALTTSNLLILFYFSFSGYATFLLARRLTGSAAAAFLAGFIFAFCPYKFAQLDQNVSQVASGMLPLSIYFLYRYFGRQGAWFDALACALLQASLFFTDLYSFLISMATVIVFGLYKFFGELRGDRRRIFFYRFGRLFTVIMLCVLPGFMLMSYQSIVGGQLFDQGWSELTVVSADFAAWFVPPLTHQLWGDSFARFYNHLKISPAEATIFIGHVVSVIVLIAIVFMARNNREIRLWRLIFFIFFILAHGPILTVSGAATGSVAEFDFSIPLPYAIFYYIDFLRPFHLPVKFSLMVFLAAAILASFVLARLLEVVDTPRWRHFMMVAFTGVIVFEYWPFPIATTEVELSPLYHKLAQGSGTVLEIPFGVRDNQRQLGQDPLHAQLGQTVSGRPIIGGMLSSVKNEVFDNVASTPILNTIIETQESSLEVPPDVVARDKEWAASFRRYYRLRDIIIGPAYRRSAVTDYLRRIFEADIISETEQDGYLHFALKPEEKHFLGPLYFGDYFFSDYLPYGFETRIVGEQGRALAVNWREKAAIVLPPAAGQDHHLTLVLRTSECRREYFNRMSIDNRGKALGEYDLSEAWRELKVSVGAPGKGEKPALLGLQFSAGAARCRVGKTDVEISVAIMATAGGPRAGAFSAVAVGDEDYSLHGPGVVVLAVNSQSGKVLRQLKYSMDHFPDKISEFAALLERIPDDTVVAVAINGMRETDRSRLVELFAGLGANRFSLTEEGYSLIGVKGAPPGSAVEDARRDGLARSVVGDYVLFDRMELIEHQQ